MYGRGFGLRWVVVAAFVIFAAVSLGTLFLDRYAGQAPGVVPLQPSSTTPTLPTAAVTPTATSPAVASVTVSPAGSVTPTSRPASSATPAAATPTPTAAGNDLLYLVNKQYSLPASYAPADLVTISSVRSTATDHKIRRLVLPYLEKLAADAKAAGYELVVSSAFRSYSEQEAVHAYWEQTLGKVQADKVSALAGHSEHQLGTTVDLTSASVGFDLTEKFGTTPEGKWLRENAHRYGFVVSYPEGKEVITGYSYEPWHVRYIGVEHATQVFQRGSTLDEYLRARR